MACFGPRCVYVLYTSGRIESRLYVGTFSTLVRGIEHALIMKWCERTWIEEAVLNQPGEDPVTVWEKPPEPMNLDQLKDWLKVDPGSHCPTIPEDASTFYLETSPPRSLSDVPHLERPGTQGSLAQVHLR